MYSISENADFVLESKPGISAYGQSGEKGDTGSDGAGFYYYNGNTVSSTLGDASTSDIIENVVKYDNSVSCKSGDLVITKNGNIFSYGVSGTNHTLTFLKNIFTDEAIPAFELSVTDVTTINSSYETFSYVQENPHYIHDYSATNSSNSVYHRDNYYRNICGLWLKFSCQEPVGESVDMTNFIYKFNINLSNGKTISKISTYSTDYIFLDVRYLLDCTPYYTVSCNTGEDATVATLLSNLKTVIDYTSVSNNNENSSSSYNNYKELLVNQLVNFSVDIINQENNKLINVIKNSLS